MRSWVFQVSVLVLLALVTVGIFLHSENGRYQFINTENNTVVIDTRTGEYWVGADVHINPRKHLVDSHPPKISEKKQP